MVVVSLKEKHVALEFEFSILDLFVFWSFFTFFEFIAFVVASSGGVMILPITKTDPTELLVAKFALHVVAALVLLNWPSALGIWAVLCVGDDPVDVFTFTVVFDVPFAHHFAVSWPMLFFCTDEAEVLATEAFDCFDYFVIYF